MAVFDAFLRLSGELEGEIIAHESLAKRTSFKVGGTADLALSLATLGDLQLACAVLKEEGVPWAVLGRGTNTLVSDAGYRGAVLSLAGDFAKHSLTEDGLLTAGAGMMLIRVVQIACAAGLGGLTFASGIPGSVGGALRMNAGAHGQSISDCLESVLVYLPSKGLVRYTRGDIEWMYRGSSLPPEAIILEASFRLPCADSHQLHVELERHLNQRKRTQPLTAKSAGSTFKNPSPEEVERAGIIGPNSLRQISAGKLIEGCGLKGYTLGGACVSQKHANFIINSQDASADDIYQLICHVIATVKEEYGIELTPELTFLGFPQCSGSA